VNGDEFKGKGRRSEVLTSEEEQKSVDHITYRQRIGSGMTYLQLQLLIQEVLVAVTSSNPERTSPLWTKVTFQTETLHIDLLRDTTLLSVQQWKYPRAGKSFLLMIWWLGKKTLKLD
jgi:hypothetical protein